MSPVVPSLVARRRVVLAVTGCELRAEHNGVRVRGVSPSSVDARAQIQEQVRSEFGDEADAVLRELDRYVGRIAANRERVQRAILERSHGSFSELKRWVEAALADDRELLHAGSTPDAPGPEASASKPASPSDTELDDDTIEETSFASLLSEIDAELDQS